MTRSLLVKFGMLVLTIGVVCWIWWQAPDPSLKPAPPGDDSKGVSARAPVRDESKPRPLSRSDHGTAVEPSRPSHTVNDVGMAAPRTVLDLNSATAKELESLPGVGAVLAERVIAYRQSVGRFQAVEDLREVAGIGSKKFNRLKPLVTVATADRKGKAEKRTL